MFYICLFRNYVINVQPLNIQRVKFLKNSTDSQSYPLKRSGKLPSNKEKLIFYNFCFTLTDISVSGVTLLAQMWFKMHGTIKVLYKVKSHSLLNAQNWIIRPTDGYDWRVWCPCHTPSKIGLRIELFLIFNFREEPIDSHRCCLLYELGSCRIWTRVGKSIWNKGFLL